MATRVLVWFGLFVAGGILGGILVAWQTSGPADTIDWTAWAAIAGWVYTLFFFFSVLVLLKQLEAAKNAAYSQAFAVAYHTLNDDETVTSKKVVWGLREQPEDLTRYKSDAPTYGGKTISVRDHARRVCRAFDQVAKMVVLEMLEEKAVLLSWGVEMNQHWAILRWFVDFEREDRTDPTLWSHFELLAARDTP